MKKITLILLVWLVSAPVWAQQKELTMEEIFRSAKFYPEDLRQLSWRPEMTAYTFVKNDTIWQGTPRFDAEPLLALTRLNYWMQQNKLDSLRRMPGITWQGRDRFRFTQGSKVYLVELPKAKVSLLGTLPEDAMQEDFTQESDQVAIAYNQFNNLYVMVPKNGSKDEYEHRQISNDQDISNLYGWAPHRREFGISKGTFWSPDANYLAYHKIDQHGVGDYPIMNIDRGPAKDTLIKYPMAGGKSENVDLGIYDVRNNKTIWMQTGDDKEQYLTNPAFSPDEKLLYIAVLNRGQNHMKLQAYDVQSGKLQKTLFEERGEKYVEPLVPMVFLPKRKDQFIWQSRRDGNTHLYLYDTDGKLIRQLTKGNFEVTELVGVDPREKYVYFIRTDNNGLERLLYRSEIKSGRMEKLSAENGIHSANLSPEGDFLLDRYESASVPRKIDFITSQGRLVRNLLTAKNPLANYNMGQTRVFTIPAEDATPLVSRMILPPNFDSTKKYPVITYVYGGPHAQMITDSWNWGVRGWQLWMHYMAQKGYIVFTMDNRGSGDRGREFEQATFRNLGTVELADQMRGVAYLKSLPYVDTARMGVHGWSFGGFMTISLMLREPGAYQVGVAGGPVIDWRLYEVMYTERYMDTPEENPEGYAQANLLDKVKNLDGRLLVIHGTADDVVVWQHSLALLKASVAADELIDYFVYPGHAHNVVGPDRMHLYKKITQYFEDHL